MSPLARLFTALVIGYQRLVSPLLGPRCRFEPSCSHYAVEALRTHGAVRGTALAGWRVLRCQPFARPGYDPVPPARHTPTRPDTRCRATVRGAGPC
jgi:putative membrane protein insertion efficiency factor